MKWFYRWLGNKIHKAAEAKVRGIEELPSKSRAYADGQVAGGNISLNGMQLTLYHANGGSVVEMVNYDPVNNRRNASLYVISASDDLGQQLAHIITVEALKR